MGQAQTSLDLDTGFGKVVVGQQLTPTDVVVSITRDGSGRRDQAALASRMLGGRAMRAALNSGPMRPVAGVRRVMCRPSLVIATSWSRSRSRSTSPHSGRKPAIQGRRMKSASQKSEHVIIVPGGLLATRPHADPGCSVPPHEVDGDLAQDGQVASCRAIPDAAVILAEGDIEDPMEPIFNRPVPADRLDQHRGVITAA